MNESVALCVADGRRATHLGPRTWHHGGHAAASGSSGADRRRRDWVDRKQKSKSFDFCWQSGMWSPIDRPAADVVGPPPPPALTAVPPATAVVTATVLATAVPPPATSEQTDECRRTSPRLKLPPMFHMDSGSSFESYEPGDGLLQHQLLKVTNHRVTEHNRYLLPASAFSLSTTVLLKLRLN